MFPHHVCRKDSDSTFHR